MPTGKPNAPIKLEIAEEDGSESSEWETIQTEFVTIDCSFVTLQNQTLITPARIADVLLETIFEKQGAATGTVELSIENEHLSKVYNASLVPACGTAILMQVDVGGAK